MGRIMVLNLDTSIYNKFELLNHVLSLKKTRQNRWVQLKLLKRSGEHVISVGSNATGSISSI